MCEKIHLGPAHSSVGSIRWVAVCVVGLLLLLVSAFVSLGRMRIAPDASVPAHPSPASVTQGLSEPQETAPGLSQPDVVASRDPISEGLTGRLVLTSTGELLNVDGIIEFERGAAQPNSMRSRPDSVPINGGHWFIPDVDRSEVVLVRRVSCDGREVQIVGRKLYRLNDSPAEIGIDLGHNRILRVLDSERGHHLTAVSVWRRPLGNSPALRSNWAIRRAWASRPPGSDGDVLHLGPSSSPISLTWEPPDSALVVESPGYEWAVVGLEWPQAPVVALHLNRSPELILAAPEWSEPVHVELRDALLAEKGEASLAKGPLWTGVVEPGGDLATTGLRAGRYEVSWSGASSHSEESDRATPSPVWQSKEVALSRSSQTRVVLAPLPRPAYLEGVIYPVHAFEDEPRISVKQRDFAALHVSTVVAPAIGTELGRTLSFGPCKLEEGSFALSVAPYAIALGGELKPGNNRIAIDLGSLSTRRIFLESADGTGPVQARMVALAVDPRPYESEWLLGADPLTFRGGMEMVEAELPAGWASYTVVADGYGVSHGVLEIRAEDNDYYLELQPLQTLEISVYAGAVGLDLPPDWFEELAIHDDQGAPVAIQSLSFRSSFVPNQPTQGGGRGVQNVDLLAAVDVPVPPTALVAIAPTSAVRIFGPKVEGFGEVIPRLYELKGSSVDAIRLQVAWQ